MRPIKLRGSVLKAGKTNKIGKTSDQISQVTAVQKSSWTAIPHKNQQTKTQRRKDEMQTPQPKQAATRKRSQKLDPFEIKSRHRPCEGAPCWDGHIACLLFFPRAWTILLGGSALLNIKINRETKCLNLYKARWRVKNQGPMVSSRNTLPLGQKRASTHAKPKKQRPSKTAENGAGAHPQKSYDCNKRFTCTEQLAQRDGFKASLEASMEIAARQKV